MKTFEASFSPPEALATGSSLCCINFARRLSCTSHLLDRCTGKDDDEWTMRISRLGSGTREQDAHLPYIL